MTQTLFGDVNAGFRDIFIIRMLRPITPPASIAAELLILAGYDKRLIAVVAELDRRMRIGHHWKRPAEKAGRCCYLVLLQKTGAVLT